MTKKKEKKKEGLFCALDFDGGFCLPAKHLQIKCFTKKHKREARDLLMHMTNMALLKQNDQPPPTVLQKLREGFLFPLLLRVTCKLVCQSGSEKI